MNYIILLNSWTRTTCGPGWTRQSQSSPSWRSQSWDRGVLRTLRCRWPNRCLGERRVWRWERQLAIRWDWEKPCSTLATRMRWERWTVAPGDEWWERWWIAGRLSAIACCLWQIINIQRGHGGTYCWSYRLLPCCCGVVLLLRACILCCEAEQFLRTQFLVLWRYGRAGCREDTADGYENIPFYE